MQSPNLTEQEWALLQLIRANDVKDMAGALNDIYQIALFEFPDCRAFESYRGSFFYVEELINVLAPRPSMAQETYLQKKEKERASTHY